MSGMVALPHVPSARASSSASNSSRQSLHSAGSTASQVSAKNLRLSYSNEDQDGEQDEGEDSEEEEEDEDEDEEEEPHESSGGSGSGGLWDEVESFLNRPSPSLVAPGKETSKAGLTSSSVLPTLRNNERKQPVAPSGGGNQSLARAGRPAVRQSSKQPSNSSSSSVGKAIDPGLLQEAFAYAERIQQVSVDGDEEDEDDGRDQQRLADRRSSSKAGIGMLRRDSSHGSTLTSGGGPRLSSDAAVAKQGSVRGKRADDKPKKKKPVLSAYGASVKPQPGKKKNPASGERRQAKDASDWDVSPSSADPNGDTATYSRRGSHSALDQQTVQSLVSNLQNGTAVEELRRELAISQQSMAMSRQVIQQAAKSFFRK